MKAALPIALSLLGRLIFLNEVQFAYLYLIITQYLTH